jgi:hypothetical protein
MKQITSLSFVATLLVFQSVCQAQSTPYADADSPGEAVGMYKMTIGLSDRMKQDCTKRFPELQSKIETDFEKWRSIDAKEIEVAEQRFREMEKKNPKLTRQFPEMVNQGYENKLIAPFKGVDPAIEKRVVRDYCQQFFSELASGVWRQRTPKTYRYLNQPQ